jgi:hypothetical protein
MPPELLSGKPFSKAVDVYMFGVLLWEIFTRDVPFRGYAVADIRRKVLAGERFRVPSIDCPDACQQLMRRCWAADPASRPGFDEIHDMLSAAAARSTYNETAMCVMEEDALDSLMKKRGK